MVLPNGGVVRRLSRTEQQEHTHALLLAAGRAVFLRRGFLAATIEDVAAEAGFTRGAVYKHFGGKEGLWQAVVDARAEALLPVLRDALAAATCHRELVAALDPSAVIRDGEAARWTTVSMEFLAAIAGRPEHAAALAARQRRLDAALVGLLDQHCRRLGIQPTMPLPHLVVALAAVGGGLALACAVDPTVDVAGVTGALLTVVLPAPDDETSAGRGQGVHRD